MRSVEGLLPPGSVVSVKGRRSFLAIVGTGQFVEDDSTKKKSYFDYVATEYPGGVESGNLAYFNREDIDTITFIGLESEAFTQRLSRLADELALFESEEVQQEVPVQEPVNENTEFKNLPHPNIGFKNLPYPFNLLPVGSVVYLKGGQVPLLIISVGVICNVKKSAKRIYFDYYGTISPGGITNDTLYFFNQSHIESVVFRGMESDEFVKYLKKNDKQVKKALRRGLLELWTRD